MPTVYITVPPDAAGELTETLVSERLAACVNQLSTTSTYRWDGEIHREDETVLLAKTSADRYDDLVDRVLEVHPHEVPCIERFDETDVLDSFTEWRDTATR